MRVHPEEEEQLLSYRRRLVITNVGGSALILKVLHKNSQPRTHVENKHMCASAGTLKVPGEVLQSRNCFVASQLSLSVK